MGCESTEYGELVARVKALEATEGSLKELAKRQMSIGDFLTKLDALCRTVNQHTLAIEDSQVYIQSLKNCNAGPTVVSVQPV